MGPETGFDMCYRNGCREAGKRCSERGRGISLHDEQVWTLGQERQQCGRDRADVAVRILLAGAVEALRGEAGQPEICRLERMLSGEDQLWQYPTLSQGVGKRREFDCFRPGADDEPDIYAVQSSP